MRSPGRTPAWPHGPLCATFSTSTAPERSTPRTALALAPSVWSRRRKESAISGPATWWDREMQRLLSLMSLLF
eukprot:scaffold380_cov272-Pinguiococcus_pyrenoidosus.AAC.16